MAILGNIFRFLFAWLDGIIITIITAIYNLIIDLSNLILSSDSIVKALGQRIGLILGIFMLFRIAITLINYLISPDKVSDSSKGGGKLIGNIILSLALLVMVNFVFNTAYKLQKQIVDSNIIGKIFFGNVRQTVDAQGNKVVGTNVSISYYLYSAFFTPNEDIAGFDSCRNLWDLSITIKNSECDKKLIELLENNARDTIHKAREKMDMSLVYTNYDLVLARKGTDTSVFNYIPGLSTACGVIAILILINFCMDLAVRAVKMLFLQIIAPIPIISNMDLIKGKEIFQKWYKECISTYLGVFIRLIAINFAVFMISIVYGNFADTFSKNVLINVFIIIGCLMFAKQVPKLLESMFGIKTDGFVLNPMKKIEDGMAFSGALGAVGAGAMAFGANVYAKDGGLFKKIGSGIAGAGSAFGRGMYGTIFKGEKLSVVSKNAYTNAMQARLNREDRQQYDINPLEIWRNKFQRASYAQTVAERQDSEVKVYDEFVSSGESLTSISESEVQKNASKLQLTNFGGIVTSARTDANGNPITDASGNPVTDTFTTLAELREAMTDQRRDSIERARLNALYEQRKSEAEKKYRVYAARGGSRGLNSASDFMDATGNSIFDANDINGETAKVYADNMVDIIARNSSKSGFAGMNATTVINDTKKSTKQVKYESAAIKNSAEFRHQHAVQDQTKKESK